jgi:hypothetical protein
MALGDYVVKVSTIGDDSKLEVQSTPAVIRQLLAILLEPLETSQNGATPGHRPPAAARAGADPPPSPPAAKPRRRYRKRPGRPPRADHANEAHANSLHPLEKKCHFCSNVFTTPYTGTKFCSPECRKKAHQLQPLPTLQAPDL